MKRIEQGHGHQRRQLSLWVAAGLTALCTPAFAVNYPITPEQRSTANQVAQSGVPLSELSPNAPESHTVVRGDTLWDISKIFLRTPWRWPELWGMNLDQIKNPHLIYPGQVLQLVKVGDRATLRVAQPVGSAVPGNTVKLSPRVRAETLDNGAIPSIPLHLIGPFLNEAVVFSTDELATAPRIVASQEGRVLLSRGETAYVRGDLKGNRDFRVFREAKPMADPDTGEVLGYEARYVGTAEFVRDGGLQASLDGKSAQIVPATFKMTGVRLEAGVGDRLAPVPARDYAAYVPHAPSQPIKGRIVSIYGEAISAGQNQIVSINRGARDGMERGHVLALWRNGARVTDTTDPAKPLMKLPDERIGTLFVFRTFERVSYALIIDAQDPVRAGDRFSQP
ncbi:MAG: LysM peptidoglycan-binding domain-containing protein [Ideonella sp.]|nr:LysM peptidoglycan-binding domain-containing protein [Ideonella sp.]MCC7456527.1 LysM peptidoglycan-binding domain-containing protein [Nitrospira sp.]